MTCFSICDKDRVASLVVYFILPLGCLVVSACVSGLSFRHNCNMRVDALVLIHNGCVVVDGLSRTLQAFRCLQNAYWVSVRLVLAKVMRMVVWLPVPMVALLITISVKDDGLCDKEWDGLGILWYYLISCYFLLRIVLFERGTFCWCMSRDLMREYKALREDKYLINTGRQLIPKLLDLRGTQEGWSLLTNGYYRCYVNLQDSQKESLLPVLLLYAIDELTWELRELPQDLHSAKCAICEEGFAIRRNIITCIPRPDLVHRDCLMRQIMSSRQHHFTGDDFSLLMTKVAKASIRRIQPESTHTNYSSHRKWRYLGENLDVVAAKLWR